MDSEVADGDDNDDDDDEEGDEEGEEGEGEESTDGQQRDTTEGTEGQDKEMTDAPQSEEPAAPELMDVEMKDDDSAKDSTPPNPLTLAPFASNLASASPKIEGSPLKNVSVPSPPEVQGAVAQNSPAVAAQPPVVIPTDDSTVAEPPSTIVGEAPEAATERDLPPVQPSAGTDEALLPPPPDQVGNISSPKASPKAESVPEHTSEGREQAREEAPSGGDAIPEKPPLVHHESALTEDTLRPDDSASVGVPATASGAPSETAPASTELAPDSGAPTETSAEAPNAPREPQEIQTTQQAQEAEGSPKIQESREPSAASKPEEHVSPATNNEPDLLGGLMGELDHEASKEESAAPMPEPPQETNDGPDQAVTETTGEPAAESGMVATETAQAPAVEPTSGNEQPPEHKGEDAKSSGAGES